MHVPMYVDAYMSGCVCVKNHVVCSALCMGMMSMPTSMFEWSKDSWYCRYGLARSANAHCRPVALGVMMQQVCQQHCMQPSITLPLPCHLPTRAVPGGVGGEPPSPRIFLGMVLLCHWPRCLPLIPPPPPCASTTLSKHTDPSDRFSDRSCRFPPTGPALSKHGDPSDRCFPDFQRACARGRGCTRRTF